MKTLNLDSIMGLSNERDHHFDQIVLLGGGFTPDFIEILGLRHSKENILNEILKIIS